MSETDNNYYISKEQGSYNFLVSDGKILRPKIATFAIYCEDDSSLTFYTDTFFPTLESFYNNREVTNLYIGFDTEDYASASDVPWYDIRRKVEYVDFDESFKNVTPISTAYWFYNFGNCKKMELDNLNTSKVISMSRMFDGCSDLTELDVSVFDTSNVTKMIDMFSSCTNLLCLDLSNFETHNMQYMGDMFSGENVIKTIYADGDKFDISNIDEWDSNSLCFVWDYEIVGGAGTGYRTSHLGYEMAHIDGGYYDSGYFTDASARDVFAMYSEDDNSLTFYHYKLPEVGDTCYGKTVTMIFTGFETETWESSSEMQWYSIRGSIEKIIVAGSFKDVQPISLAYWFYDMENATFRGLENIDTSHATSFAHAFYNCNGLTNVDDISAWDTSNVTLLRDIFHGCSNLLKINGLEQWDTSHVIDFEGIFYFCESLINVDAISKWNISKAIYLNNFFEGCANLINIDISNWQTANVINMERMFFDCSSLVTIYSNDNNFVVSSLEMDGDRLMFYNCYNLVGGNGTVYNSSKITSEMAHIDTESNPGYFTSKDA